MISGGTLTGWYPDAIRKPVDRYKIGGSNHTPMPNPGRLCFHTAVSSGDSLFELFNTRGNAVAHFYIRKDGKCEQYVNANVEASANLDGNHDTISVESWDNGGQRETWTLAQIDTAAKIAAWVHTQYNIPLERCDASEGSRGITWHRKGIDGNFPSGLLSGRKSGDERWSVSFGKVCPFDGKIKGIVSDIIPLARLLLKDGDDMAWSEWPDRDKEAFLTAVKHAVWDDTETNPNRPSRSVSMRTAVAQSRRWLSRILNQKGR